MTATNALRFLAAALLLTLGGGVAAQAPVKIALIGEFTGPFADYGTQIHNGMKAATHTSQRCFTNAGAARASTNNARL